MTNLETSSSKSGLIDLEALDSKIETKLSGKFGVEDSHSCDFFAYTHVAIYLDSLQGYGADRIIVKVANGLAQQGLIVDLVLSKVAHRELFGLEPQVKVIKLGGSRFTPIKNIFSLSKYLKGKKPSVLFSSIHFNNITAALALKLSGINSKLVLRQANTLKEQFKDYPLPVSIVLHLLTFLAYKQADIVISQSEAMVSDIVEFIGCHRKKVKVINNPTASPDILVKASEEVAHKWLFPDRRFPVILSSGRLKPQKDFATLLNAFSILKANHIEEIKLILLGEGPLRSQLEEMAVKLGIHQSVDFIGFQENPYPFMAAADIYVSSSRYEGLPNTVIEALLLGKRVVATACPGGTAEVLKFGKFGNLIPVGNADVMARSILDALSNQLPLGCECTKDFDFMNQTEKYCRLLREILVV